MRGDFSGIFTHIPYIRNASEAAVEMDNEYADPMPKWLDGSSSANILDTLFFMTLKVLINMGNGIFMPSSTIFV